MNCCYCGKEITDILDSHNPDDGSIDFWDRHHFDARCCSTCNGVFVVPARIMNLRKEKEKCQEHC